MPQKKWLVLGAFSALVVIAMRTGLHVPNMVPVGALALWAGAYLGKRFAMPIIVGLLFIGDIGDIARGQYAWQLMAVVYSAMLIYVALGSVLARHVPEGCWRIGASFIAACAGSIAYFAITNGAVWALSAWTGAGWYPKTAAGLASCMIAGIPFWRNDMIINAMGTVLVFGASAAIATTASRVEIWQAEFGNK
jgi:hypothetical protein